MMAAGLLPTQAQVIVQNLSFSLKGVMQGEGATQAIRISNKEILTALGTELETDFTGGKLMVVNTGEGAVIIVRKAGQEDTDVTAFVSKEQISDGVVVDRSTETTTDLTTISINRFTFGTGGDTPTEFDVQGYTNERTRSVSSGGEIIGDVTDTKASPVAGTGQIAGALAIVNGSVSITGKKVEQTGE